MKAVFKNLFANDLKWAVYDYFQEINKPKFTDEDMKQIKLMTDYHHPKKRNK